MAERSYPFVHEAGSTGLAGATTDAEYSQMFRRIFETGVVGSAAGSELRTYANSTGLNVKVPGGQAFVRGHFYNSNDQKTLLIAVGDTAPRIDSVILRMEYAGVNDIHLEIRKGTPSSDPKPATLIQTETGVFELLLATVAVGAGASTITAADVTDRRIFTGIRPISGGGTGATTAAGARSALGVAAAAHFHDIADITHSAYNGGGRDGFWQGYLPDNYAAKSHVHDIANIRWNGGGNGSFLNNYLPAVYAPKSHGHHYSQIDVPGVGNIVDWANRQFVDNSEMSVHINNLNNSIAGKSPNGHQHNYWDVLVPDSGNIADWVNGRVDAAAANARPIYQEFVRATQADAPFNGQVALAEGTIPNARAGLYRIIGHAALYANSAANGFVFVQVGGQRVTFRHDIVGIAQTAIAEMHFWHGGGDLPIQVGYATSQGNPVSVGKPAGQTKVAAIFLGS